MVIDRFVNAGIVGFRALQPNLQSMYLLWTIWGDRIGFTGGDLFDRDQ